ncbi:MAG: lamin tail domain-containing protein, partial [Chthoniobacteraceae bacterium]
YAIRNRNAPGATWQWFVWDQEIVLDNASMNRIGSTDSNTPGALLQALRQNAEFRLLFADRAQRHLFNNGALSLTASQDRWQAIATQLDKAIVAESARWGDTASTTPYGNTPSKPLYTREADWLPTVNSVRNSYLPALYNESLSTATIRKLRAANLFPATVAPSFAQHGGNVPHGYELAITAPAGSIYYTLDGSDPREAITGNPRGTLYSGVIPLTATGTVKARARNGSEWSALAEARFIVGVAASATNLAIAELHYHPASDEALEFVELVNRSSETIDLTGVSFAAGITFTFPDNLLLAPGARILVVRDLAAFKAQYGEELPIAGEYSGALDNNGEEIALVAADGSDIFRFRYDDSRPWPAAPDDQGRSLVFPTPSADPKDPANWRSSVAVGGAPGTTDRVVFTGNVSEDADGDGLNALLEHALGTSDSDPDSGAVPLVQLEEFMTEQGLQQFLTITAPRNLAADDALLRAEFSTDLQTWQSGPAAVVFIEERVAPNGNVTLKWRAAQPAAASDGPPQFLRVRANHVP